MPSLDSTIPFGQPTAILRILDANANRVCEGLRVVEEYARFVLDDAAMAATYKNLRHDLRVAIDLPAADLLRSRETSGDVGIGLQTTAEYKREDLQDVVQANLKRIEQALRVLEEYVKVLSPQKAMIIEQLRYRAYQAAKTLGVAIFRPQQLTAARLYALIDGQNELDTFATYAQKLVLAGVSVIQLRDKELSDRSLLERARKLRDVTRGKSLMIMNDRPDLAVLADADGVHVGQEELSVKEARVILGPRRLIGVSTHSLPQAQQAVADGADYIGCGPTFPSETKRFAEFPGLEFLRQVAEEIALPAFAIGGVTVKNVDLVLATGIQRVAVSSALGPGKDISTVVQTLQAKLDPKASPQ